MPPGVFMTGIDLMNVVCCYDDEKHVHFHMLGGLRMVLCLPSAVSALRVSCLGWFCGWLRINSTTVPPLLGTCAVEAVSPSLFPSLA